MPYTASAPQPFFTCPRIVFLLASLCCLLWGVLPKFNRVSTVAAYRFLVPVFGACLSALFLGESLLEWKYLVALLMVSIGIWWVSRV